MNDTKTPYNIRITFEMQADRKLTTDEILAAIHNHLHLNESMQDFMGHKSEMKPFTIDYVRVAESDLVQTPTD